MPPLSWQARCQLAQDYAPQLVLFPEDKTLLPPGFQKDGIGDYHPRGVGPLLERGHIDTGWFQSRLDATFATLATSQNPQAQLLILGQLIPNAARAWQTYFDILDSANRDGQTGRDRFPLAIYARVLTRGEANAAVPNNADKEFPPSPNEIGRPFFKPDACSDDDVALQYWFCYYYDDWENQHEGDWEGMCVFLRHTAHGYEPAGAMCYAHENGTRRHWMEVERARTNDTHPLVYVAAGSHASYFQFVNGGYFVSVPGFILPVIKIRLNVSYATFRFDIVPDPNKIKPLAPRAECLPDPLGPDDKNDTAWMNEKWLRFPGSWGVRFLAELGHAGPKGPAQKGLKWSNPFAWMERGTKPDAFVY